MADTYKLSNIDHEDLSEVLLKIEHSFDIRFDETELKNTGAFGALCDLVKNKVQGQPSDDCTTQQAFYKIRDAITVVSASDKSTLMPETQLQHIFPRHDRRRKIACTENILGFKMTSYGQSIG